MSVELVPKNEEAGCMGVANGTWFYLLDNTEIGNIVNPQHTNDEIKASADDAEKCLEAIKKFIPPDGWGMTGKEEEMKNYFIDFFSSCGGFTTY